MLPISTVEHHRVRCLPVWDEARPKQADNAPGDVQLWKSAALHVQCTHPVELNFAVHLIATPLMSGVALNDFVYVMVSGALFIVVLCPCSIGRQSTCGVQWAAAR